MRKILLCFLTMTILSAAAAERRFDVVIYGGTAGGVMSAIAAAQEGASVIVLEPTTHIGGMVTGGLGATDIGKPQAIGGLSREFYRRIYRYYEQPGAWKYETRSEYIKRAAKWVNVKERVWWSTNRPSRCMC
jgi:flavin-dependent dehydrogenase